MSMRGNGWPLTVPWKLSALFWNCVHKSEVWSWCIYYADNCSIEKVRIILVPFRFYNQCGYYPHNWICEWGIRFSNMRSLIWIQIPLAIVPLIKAFYPQCLVPRIGLACKVIRFLVTHLPQTHLPRSHLHLSRKSCSNWFLPERVGLNPVTATKTPCTSHIDYTTAMRCTCSHIPPNSQNCLKSVKITVQVQKKCLN